MQCSVVYDEETNIRYIFVAPLLLGVGKPQSQKLRSRHLETAALILFMPFVAFVYREWLGQSVVQRYRVMWCSVVQYSVV